MSKQLCLKWNDHTNNLLGFFDTLISTEAFADVTLACDGQSLKAHKIVLSACSPFFKCLFLENPSKHPIVIMKDTKYCDLKALIKFIYSGEVSVSQDQLDSFLITAETLQVRGLEKITAQNRHALGIGKQKNVANSAVPTPTSPPHIQPVERVSGSSLPSTSKKARHRKRPLLDSSRSDEEGVAAKMKGRASQDVVDIPDDAVQELPDAAACNISSTATPGLSNSLFMVSLHSLDDMKNSSKSHPSILPDLKTADEVNESEVEPSSVLEQTLIVHNTSPVKSNKSKRTQLPSVGSSKISRESISNRDVLSQSLVCTSDSNSPDSPPDIKPEIISIDDNDNTMSPVAGPSHSSENTEMSMGYSGVSFICGNSIDSSSVARNKSVAKGKVRGKKQSKSKQKLPEIKKEPWKQVLHMCSDCSYTSGNIEELVSHIEYHKKSATQCEFCKIDFNELRITEDLQIGGENVVECEICNHCFCSKMALLTHKLLHH